MTESIPNESPVARRVLARSIDGFVARDVPEGSPAEVQRSFITTSDDPGFHLSMSQVESILLVPLEVRGESITHLFATQQPDGTTNVYLSYTTAIQGQAARDISAGETIFESDINLSTINSYRPVGINVQADNTVICVIKVGWKYGLYFNATRDVAEEDVWRGLGDLYRTLLLERTIVSLRDKFRQNQQMHIITEGKTDWRHIEVARQILSIDLPLGYAETDQELGDTALLELCKRMSQFGPRNKNKIVAVFDSDNPKILKALHEKGHGAPFQSWGNNIYSLAIPIPPHRINYQHVCIELLYTDDDLARPTDEGKRLFFDNETMKEIPPAGPIRYRPIDRVASEELRKKPHSDEASLITDDDGRIVGLSKARFADFIYSRAPQFDAYDRKGFAGIFEALKNIASQ